MTNSLPLRLHFLADRSVSEIMQPDSRHGCPTYRMGKREREAFYKSEILRRITEASGESAKAAIELLKEDDRLKRISAREGLKIGGVVCIGVGIGLVIFLWTLIGPKVALCGLIPGFIGVAMLIYVFLMAVPIE